MNDRRPIPSAGLIPVVAVLGALVLWASAFTAIRIGIRSFDPFTLAFIRFAFASILLGAIALVRRPRVPGVRDLMRIAIASLLLFVVYNVGVNIGERTVSAGAASLLVATAPLFTAIIANTILRERLGVLRAIGVVVGFVGAAIVVSDTSGGLRFDVGAIAVLVAAGSEAAAFVIQKPLLERHSPREFNTYALFIAAAALLPAAPAALGQVLVAPLEALAAALYLAVGPTTLAYGPVGFCVAPDVRVPGGQLPVPAACSGRCGRVGMDR